MLLAFGGFLVFVVVLGRVFYGMTYPGYSYDREPSLTHDYVFPPYCAERDFTSTKGNDLTIIEVKDGKNLSRGREVVTYQPRSYTKA